MRLPLGVVSAVVVLAGCGLAPQKAELGPSCDGRCGTVYGEGGPAFCGGCASGEICGGGDGASVCSARPDNEPALVWFEAQRDQQFGGVAFTPQGDFFVGTDDPALTHYSAEGQVLERLDAGRRGTAVQLDPNTGELLYAGWDPRGPGMYGSPFIAARSLGGEVSWTQWGSDQGVVLGFGTAGGVFASFNAGPMRSDLSALEPRRVLWAGVDAVVWPHSMVASTRAPEFILALGATDPTSQGERTLGLQLESVSPDGAVRWSRLLASQALSSVRARMGAEGTLVLLGSSGERSGWGQQLGAPTGTGAGAFLAALEADGTPRWHRDLAFPQAGRVFAVSAEGRIAVAHEVNGCEGITLELYDREGTRLGWKTINPTRCADGSVTAKALAFAPNGDVVLTGEFEGMTDFGNGARNPRRKEAFIARYRW